MGFAPHPIHNLEVLGVDGAHQPVPPRHGPLSHRGPGVAVLFRHEEGVYGERGIPEPTKPVIPIMVAPDDFREGGGGGCKNRPIGECQGVQYHGGAFGEPHPLAVIWGQGLFPKFPMWHRGFAQGPGQCGSGRQVKGADKISIPAGVVQFGPVEGRDRLTLPVNKAEVIVPGWGARAIVGADFQIMAYGDIPGGAGHGAHQGGSLQVIHHLGSAGGGKPCGVKNQVIGVIQIGAGGHIRIINSDAPAAVFWFPQESREGSSVVDLRAEPVNPTGAGNQRHGVVVGDKCVFF